MAKKKEFQNRINKKSQNRIKKTSRIIPVILLVSVFFLAFCSKPKVYKVGVLCGLKIIAEITDGFKTKMTELGYIDGKNITYDVQQTDFDMAAYDRILKKFIKEKVDLILVFPTEAAQQAKSVTKGTDIPVIFANAFIEDTGLVNSVQEPGENLTGVRWPGPEMTAKVFEILLALVPQAKRVWVCYQKDYPIVKSQLEVVQKAALNANITLIEVPASSPAELKAELLKQTGPFDTAFIHLIFETLMSSPEGFPTLANFAAKYNIPIGGAPFFDGDYQSVFSMIPEPIPQGKQAAYLADKIFKGTPAGKLPVLTAEHSFVFNYRQAEKLKLNITESLLSQADQVIR